MRTWSVGSTLRSSVSARVLTIALSAPVLAVAPYSCAWAGGALPASGQYVAGTGTIAPKGSNGLTINQSSNTGIINWSSFSIGKGNSVQFNNGTGATLNRVTGGDLSTIAGSLKATGSLYLINPQGVIVTGTGKVMTGGTFVGSSRDESDSDFLNGKRRFSGTSKGTVTNAGTIRSANGDVALIGDSASNTGTVSAKNGTASLSASNQVLLAPTGSSILVSGGTGDASNSGTLQGAQAQINAAGGNVYALAGNNGGIVRAAGSSTVGGHIWLTSGTGTTTISGSVSASNADGSGGIIEATGKSVAVTGSANVSASGTTGGIVLLGGDIHGGSIASDNFARDKLATAQTTIVAHGAKINADGTKGSGGHVVLWSDDHTAFDGAISAKGSNGGAGGSAEVSSHDLLGFTGTVDLTGANGQAGTLLLDPYDVIISNDVSSNTALSSTIANSSYSPTGNTSNINVQDLENALDNANVAISTGGGSSPGTQAGNIAVIDPVTVAGHGLTLSAFKSIVIGAPMSFENTSLNLSYGGSLDFVGGGRLNFSSTGSHLTINTTSYTLLDTMSAISSIASNPSGNYALATNINATSDGFSLSPVNTTFTGKFEGLGNSIANLQDASSALALGLFSGIGAGGSVRDLDLINPVMEATSPTGTGTVGALAGVNRGTISNVRVLGGSVIADSAAGIDTGGLVGDNLGTINSSSANDTVGGRGDNIGGLVGFNGATDTINNSSATGAVTSTATNPAAVGGLAGTNSGSVSNSYATGTVTGRNLASVGGLVGINRPGATLATSYATGAVHGGLGSLDGGLAGLNQGGVIGYTYATGSVLGGGANGTDPSFVGGLVGDNENSGSTGTITQSYSVGAVSSSGSGDDVGGFVGKNGTSAVVTDSYFDTDMASNSGHGSGLTNGASAGPLSGAVGLTTAQMMNTANMPQMSFGTTPGTAGFFIPDLNGTANNSSGAAGGSLPFLLGEATSASDVHIITNAHQMQLIDLDTTGTYFLGGDIDMSGTSGGNDAWAAATGFVPIAAASTGFVGQFYGLGHAINDPFIDNTTLGYVGLFSEFATNGTVADNFSVNDARVTGNNTVGVVAGFQEGLAENIFVSGSDESLMGSVVGGALGTSFGGTMRGLSSSVSVYGPHALYTGGLVGDSSGAISDSYATGRVQNGGGGWVGGLAGNNNGTIADSYAIGRLFGMPTTSFGGLVGQEQNTSNTAITQSYFDTETTGKANGLGSGTPQAGISAETTAQLQAALPTGFDSTKWGILPGISFPYLKSQFPGGAPYVVSGMLYSDNGVTHTNPDGDVELQMGPDSYADLDVYADGSYYTLLKGPLSRVLASGEGVAGQAYEDTGNAVGLDIYGSGLNVRTNDTELSVLVNNIAATQGEAEDFTTIDGPLNITDSNDFDIDQNLNLGTNSLSLQSHGIFNETGLGSITAYSLSGSSIGGMALNGANLISKLGGFTNTGGGNIALTDGEALYVSGGNVNAGTGNVTLSTTGAGHALNIGSSVITGTTVSLTSAGTMNETGSIHATTLLGSSVGGTTLNGANLIGAFDSFSNTGGGNIALTDAQTLYIGGGGVNAGTGNVTLTTTGAGHNLSLGNVVTGTTVNLFSAGTMLEGGSGAVHATTLLGSSVGGATLNDANLVGAFDSFSNTGGGNIALTNAQALYIGGGGVNAGTGNVTLTTTGVGHALTLGNVVTGTTVGLTSAGTISEGGAGAVHATTLLGSSVSGATLNDANLIGAFDSFTNTGGGNIALTDAQALYVGGGGVSAGTGNVTLTTTGAGHGLSVGNVVTGTTVNLLSAGSMLEGGAGAVHATTLEGTSSGGATLNGANLVGAFDSFTNTGGGNVALTDAQTLYVGGGGVSAGTGNVALTTTGAASNLSIGSALSGATVTLTTAGEALEGSAAALTATSTLNVSAGTGINLNSTHNHIHAVGTRHTNSGPNVIAGIGM